MMQQYPAYKDSSLNWLSKIPVHWDELPNIAIFQERIERGFEANELLSVTMAEGIIRQNELETKKDISNENKSNYKRVRTGDIAYNKMRMWQGAVGYSRYEGIVSPAYVVLRPKCNINPKYFHYLFRIPWYTNESYRNSYGIHDDQLSLRYVDFKRMYSPFPPIEEQEAIVAFLEEQTAVINQFLANKRQLIALLEEQKQVVINTAVTQGLDPNAPRKPSGIDWLGEIPAHWEGIKLKNLSKFIQTGPFGSQLHAHDYVDNQTPIINPIHLQNGRIIPDWSITVDDETLKRLERHQLEVGDVILARRGELGRCAVVDSESAGWLCGTGSMNLRPKSDRIFSPYLAQIIQSEKVKNWLTTESVGSTMDNLNGSILGNLKVPVPPVQEQKQIIHSCREREAVINAAIKRIQREIELIEEYRTTLIAHAVTGKIDVRSQPEMI